MIHHALKILGLICALVLTSVMTYACFAWGTSDCLVAGVPPILLYLLAAECVEAWWARDAGQHQRVE